MRSRLHNQRTFAASRADVWKPLFPKLWGRLEERSLPMGHLEYAVPAATEALPSAARVGMINALGLQAPAKPCILRNVWG